MAKMNKNYNVNTNVTEAPVIVNDVHAPYVQPVDVVNDDLSIGDTLDPSYSESSDSEESQVGSVGNNTIEEGATVTVDGIKTDIQVEVEQAVAEQELKLDIDTTSEVKKELTIDEVAALIKDGAISMQDKFDMLKTVGPVNVSMLVARLLSYELYMAPTAVQLQPAAGVGKNFDLYNTLKSVITTTDKKLFNVLFDIVNMFFITYKNSAFNKYNLLRHDMNWKWGNDKLNLYMNLVTTIALLANKATRVQNIAKLDFNLAFSKSNPEVTDTVIDNIKAYYLR